MEQDKIHRSPPILAYATPRRPRGNPALAGLLAMVCMGMWLAGVSCIAASMVALVTSIAADQGDVEVAATALILVGLGACSLASRLGNWLPGIGTGE